MLKTLLSLSCLVALSTLSASPNDSLNKLMEGNKRFHDGKPISPNQTPETRKSLVGSQSPFAVIVTCSDSRVAPELVFDQGIGDLFVVRVAGNVVGPLGLESIEYAAHELGSSCILVMGHKNCGAVDAVIQKQTGDIRFIAQLVEPSVAKARSQENTLEAAIKLNAKAMSEFLSQSPILKKLIAEDKLVIKPAYYNFNSGLVELVR